MTSLLSYYKDSLQRLRCQATGKVRREERPHAAPIRTASEMDAKIVIPPLVQVPVYRKIAQKVAELRHLNMTFAAIAKSLNVSKQLTITAFRYYQDQNPE